MTAQAPQAGANALAGVRWVVAKTAQLLVGSEGQNDGAQGDNRAGGIEPPQRRLRPPCGHGRIERHAPQVDDHGREQVHAGQADRPVEPAEAAPELRVAEVLFREPRPVTVEVAGEARRVEEDEGGDEQAADPCVWRTEVQVIRGDGGRLQAPVGVVQTGVVAGDGSDEDRRGGGRVADRHRKKGVPQAGRGGRSSGDPEGCRVGRQADENAGSLVCRQSTVHARLREVGGRRRSACRPHLLL